MKCYVVGCFAGFVALDDDFNLLDYELFPTSELLEKWNQSQGKIVNPEEEFILNKMGKICDEIVIETGKSSYNYKNLKYNSIFTLQIPSKGGDYLRSHLEEVLQETGFLDLDEDLESVIRNLSIQITERKLKESSESDDLLLIQAIHAMDELEEAEVKLIERIREWYSIHFPELEEVRDHARYVEFVAEYGDRDSVINAGVLNLEGSVSLGADLSPADLDVIQGFARTIKSIQESKKSTADYVDVKMDEMAPNLRDLVGASLGAKIIAHTGGIKRLALLPSSTVQILGAEKALFRHLKTGEKPPKHGLIYQHPDVRGSRWWIRGKIARALAGKISLAVRKDYFSGKLDPSIKEGFQEKLKGITKEHPFPKRTEKSKMKKKQGKKRKKKKDKFRYKKGQYQY
ncbi:NOP5/NOP56 family protein [Methanobacterium petrolearium]|uniref:NOP5/NOP56 family protein n=1 Tax=Methanobacterium petrolearium TaxID=710190 RepID=UPI001AE83AD1|nr:ATP-binding protein [Methanobacterium petrolearium]MBP1946785.1 nucleolar protein 56 [Methanobacterium petrolearium]